MRHIQASLQLMLRSKAIAGLTFSYPLPQRKDHAEDVTIAAPMRPISPAAVSSGTTYSDGCHVMRKAFARPQREPQSRTRICRRAPRRGGRQRPGCRAAWSTCRQWGHDSAAHSGGEDMNPGSSARTLSGKFRRKCRRPWPIHGQGRRVLV